MSPEVVPGREAKLIAVADAEKSSVLAVVPSVKEVTAAKTGASIEVTLASLVKVTAAAEARAQLQPDTASRCL